MKRMTCALTLATLTILWLTQLPAAAQSIANVWTSPTGIELERKVETLAQSDNDGMVLTLSGPEGFYRRTELGAGEPLEISIYDEDGGLIPDGSYTWELRVVPANLERRSDDGAPVSGDALGHAAARRSPAFRVQSGSFTVVDGAILAGDEAEPGARATAAGNTLSSKTTVLSNDNGVIYGSLCVGLDCAANEAFGFDTIRLKENNARLQFDDTSSSAGFPTTNWQIRANSSTPGGASFLGFVDQGPSGLSESGDLVFAVEANAPESALYVDDQGRVGFGTSTPATHLHALDGNTPTLRLEQDGSSGFAAQTWDVAGNELNFFVRDRTNGSQLPLRIRSGAPNDSIYVSGTGDVGLGVSSPAARLDVLGDIALSGTVDGRDVAADGSTLDAHVADFDNPHAVTAIQAGADPAGTAASAVAAHEATFDHGNIPSALPVPVAEGGTGATDAATARANLGIAEDLTKAGILLATGFSGKVPTATVTFAEPFAAGTVYAVLLTAVTADAKTTTPVNVLTKDENGFSVTLGKASAADLVEVDWLARPVGE